VRCDLNREKGRTTDEKTDPHENQHKNLTKQITKHNQAKQNKEKEKRIANCLFK